LFSVITEDLTLSSKDQNVFCIVNCKEDYDNLKLACKPIFQLEVEHEHQSHSLPHLPSDSVMFSAYHEYGKIPMALSCRHSGFYGPYTMDRNNYIEIHPTQKSFWKIFLQNYTF
jgi:hypothetical protein